MTFRPGPCETARCVNTWTQEELVARYRHGLSVSTRLLLEALVRMFFQTFKSTRNYRSVRDYCLKELQWNESQYWETFTSEERETLKVDPIRKPYTIDLNVKILTKVWTGVSELVVNMVRELMLLLARAAHEPPSFSSLSDLVQRLCQIFKKMKELRSKILGFCQGRFEKELKKAILRQWRTKRSLVRISKQLSHCEVSMALCPLERANIAIAKMYQYDSIDRREGSLTTLEPRRFRKLSLDLPRLSHELENGLNKMSKAQKRVQRLEEAYLSLLQKELVQIAEALVDVGEEEKSSSDLDIYVSELRHEQGNLAARIKVIGKSEVVGISVRRTTVVCVHAWLLYRQFRELRIDKLYSQLHVKSTRKCLSCKELLSRHLPSVVVIAGPVGSGKTSLSHFIFRQWQDCNALYPHLSEADLVLVLTSKHASSQSFARYLCMEMLPGGLRNVPSDQVYATLQRLKVVFVLDLNFVTENVYRATQELSAALGGNSLIVLSRPETKGILQRLLIDANLNPMIVDLDPLEGPLLESLCLDLMKGCSGNLSFPTRQVNHHIKDCALLKSSQRNFSDMSPGGIDDEASRKLVKTFLKKLLSQKRDDELMFPLPLAYLIFLWKENNDLTKITSMTSLLQAVVSSCRSKLILELSESMVTNKREISVKADQVMERLYQMSWETLASKMLFSPSMSECYSSLSALLLPKRIYKNHTHVLIHSSLAEFLHASAVVSHTKTKRRIVKRFEKSNLSEVFPLCAVENTGGKYADVIRHVLSMQCQVPLYCTEKRARYLVRLYREGGIDGRNYPAWVRLLRASAWNGAVVKAVSKTIEKGPNWILHQDGSDHEEMQALCDLVIHGVYLPLRVTVISHIDPRVMQILRKHKEIGVNVIPPPDYKGVRELKSCDILVHDLQDPGSLEEFWGRLGEKGASAFASMRRLHTVHLCLASLPALKTFCTSVKCCRVLRYLYLYLELPPTMPTDDFPTLHCPTALSTYLYLSGINDHSWIWVVQVVNRLGGPFQMVTLSHSALSPPNLQALKEQLHPTRIHMQ